MNMTTSHIGIIPYSVIFLSSQVVITSINIKGNLLLIGSHQKDKVGLLNSAHCPWLYSWMQVHLKFNLLLLAALLVAVICACCHFYKVHQNVFFRPRRSKHIIFVTFVIIVFLISKFFFIWLKDFSSFLVVASVSFSN